MCQTGRWVQLKETVGVIDMAKVRISEIALNYSRDVSEIDALVEVLLDDSMVTGRGKGKWIDERGQIILSRELEVREASMNIRKMQVLSQARNSRYVYAYDREEEKRVPVLLPRQLQGKCLNKNIPVEIITDGSGNKSYRCPSKRIF